MEADFCHDTPKHLHPCPSTGAYLCFPISLPDTSPQSMWHTRHDTPCSGDCEVSAFPRPSGSRLGCGVRRPLTSRRLAPEAEQLCAFSLSEKWVLLVMQCLFHRVNLLFFLCLTLLSLDPSPQPSPRGLPLRDTFYTTLGYN